MVERITSRRSTLRTLPALREEALPRPWAQRMCRGVHTESSADRSEMGKIDRSRRRRGCAGALRHKICTASLDNRPLIDGFVFLAKNEPAGRYPFAGGMLDAVLVGFVLRLLEAWSASAAAKVVIRGAQSGLKALLVERSDQIDATCNVLPNHTERGSPSTTGAVRRPAVACGGRLFGRRSPSPWRVRGPSPRGVVSPPICHPRAGKIPSAYCQRAPGGSVHP